MLKKLASETAVYGLSSIVGRLLNYFLVPLYTNLFLPSDYGIVTSLYAWVGLLNVLFVYRMETGFFRFGTPPESRDSAYATFSMMLLLTTPLFCGLMIGFADPIARWLEYEGKGIYVVWFALILGLDTISAIPFAKLRLDSRPWRFAAIKLTNIGTNIGLNLFFLLLCPFLYEQGYAIAWFYRPDWTIEYIFISNLAASGISLLLLLPSFFNIKIKFDRVLLRKAMIYVLPLVLVGLAGVINEVIDRILLKWLLPYDNKTNDAMIGIYGACYKLAMLLSLFTQAFNYAAEPFFFRNANRAGALENYAKIALYFSIAGLFGFLGITLYLDIAQNFVGQKYREGLAVVPILLLANLFLGIYYNFAIWYKLKDKTLIGGAIALGGAIITIVLNLIWIPTLGYIGSAWATLICYASMSAACYLIGRRYLPVPYPILRMSFYLVLALALYALNLWFRHIFGDATPMLFALNTLLILGFAATVMSREYLGRGYFGRGY